MSQKYIPTIVPGSETLLMEAVMQDGRGNNDFCICQDDNGLWHLFSITWYKASSEQEPRCHLSHATADKFLGPWTRQPYILLSPTNNWAPHIVRDPKDSSKFLMFLGGMPHDTLRSYEADSRNLFAWKLRKDFGQVLGSRDPMVLYAEEEKQYYMYVTYTSRDNGNLGVAVSVSGDLDNWQLRHIIKTVGSDVVDESPFVVYKEGYYYLWATWSSRSYYRGIPTRVFRSAYPDFRDLPTTEHSNCISSIPVHAVEIVEAEGKQYLCQTGTGGPGIVANELRWAQDGEYYKIPAEELTYSGSWYWDTIDYFSAEPGATASFRFTGKRVELRGSKAMNGGQVDIYLDGVLQGSFDTYVCECEVYSDVYRNAFIWVSQDLSEGEHELKVAVSGKHNILSESCSVYINHLLIVQ